MSLSEFGLRRLGMEALRSAAPRWDIVSFPEASTRRALVLEEDTDTRAAPQQWFVISDARDAASETWLLQRCARRGLQHGELAIADPADIEALLALHELGLRAIDPTVADLSVLAGDDGIATITLGSLQAESSAIVRLVDSTLYDALKMNASDIHLESDPGGLRVLYRLDGVLVAMTSTQGRESAEQAISRIKVLAELDIAERRIPQDGRFKVKVAGRDVDFRVSVMPSIHGEDAVLRLLDRKSLNEQSQGLTLDSLGLDTQTILSIRRLAQRPYGMLLVTGPTGSGKTTTLYGAIREIHTGRDKIVTIEDPVEYRLPGVLQIPVNENKGLTFARGLRSILRHDPDKIMVGEIRDTETAQIAVQAALTGHLVFTTVHANNVFDVLGRFLHMGVDVYSFAASLNGIVAQRLLRMNCPQCSVDAPLDKESLQLLGLTPQAVAGWRLRAGAGCGHCRGTGYKGRHAVAEVLVLDDDLRELIAQRAPVPQVKQAAARAGWVELRQKALDLVRTGHSTLAEVARVAG